MPTKLLPVDSACPTREIVFGNTPLVIGRHADADVQIPHFLVSRFHCEIAEVDGVCTVRDLGSLCGILVNGEPVTEEQLNPGDTLTIGVFKFRVVVQAESAVSKVLQKLNGLLAGRRPRETSHAM